MMPAKIPHELHSGIEVKRCSKCGQWLPLEEYNKNKTAPDGYENQCKQCKKAYRDSRYYENLEHCRQLARESYQRNIEQRKKYNHLPEVRAKDVLGTADWTRRNPIRAKINHAVAEFNRRNKLAAVNDHTITPESWQALLQEYGGRCAHCGTPDNITMDHIKPIARGGAHSILNIQPLCKSCNSRKWANEE